MKSCKKIIAGVMVFAALLVGSAVRAVESDAKPISGTITNNSTYDVMVDLLKKKAHLPMYESTPFATTKIKAGGRVPYTSNGPLKVVARLSIDMKNGKRENSSNATTVSSSRNITITTSDYRVQVQ